MVEKFMAAQLANYYAGLGETIRYDRLRDGQPIGHPHIGKIHRVYRIGRKTAVDIMNPSDGSIATFYAKEICFLGYPERKAE
jgi:hypothetical protein